MEKFIPLASPDIRAEDLQIVTDVLRSGMLVQGPHVNKLEQDITSYLHCSHAMALSNGTATLHLALIAMGVKPGDEIIVPAFSYIATANAVELVGATPVFTDIEPGTFNIDIGKIEEKITSRTKGIIPVHEFGLSCDILGLKKIADQYSLFIIEDAACALGAKQNETFTGTVGDFGSFSFHPRKAITSGEGGMLTTHSKALADRIRILRNHGIEMQNEKMEFVEPGFNYRMTDFQAALVGSQLKRLDAIISYKNELAKVYEASIKNPGIKLPVTPADRLHTFQTYHVVLDKKINRDQAIITLKAAGIGSNYGAQCMPAQKFYFKKYGLNSEQLFPNAWEAYTQGLAIPIYEKLNEKDISYIAEQLNKLA